MTAEQAISWLTLKPKDLPVFVLIATDPFAPQVIFEWIKLAKYGDVKRDKLEGAHAVLYEFFNWPEKKLPS